MARAENCRPCHYEFKCYITGHHVYKDIWTTVAQEELHCEIEPTNPYDRHAIKVMKGDTIVGHIPKSISKICSFILLSGGYMKLRVTRRRENKRGNGLEVPCTISIKCPFYTFVKAEPILKDLCKRLF